VVQWLRPVRSGPTTSKSPQADGSKKVVQFKPPSSLPVLGAVRLPFMPEDPRIVDSTGALNCAR
jgi:dihydrolipoamide dehydrogenase